MKRKRFTEEQITYALRQAEAGTPVAEICRKLEQIVADQTLDKQMLQDVLRRSPEAGSQERVGGLRPRRLRRQRKESLRGARDTALDPLLPQHGRSPDGVQDQAAEAGDSGHVAGIDAECGASPRAFAVPFTRAVKIQQRQGSTCSWGAAWRSRRSATCPATGAGRSRCAKTAARIQEPR